MAEKIIEGGSIFVFAGDKYFGHSQKCSIKLSTDQKETSSKDIEGDWKVSRPGRKSMEIQVSGLTFLDSGDSEKLDQADIISNFMTGALLDVMYKPKTPGTDKYMSAKMYISSYDQDDSNDENSTYSVTLSLNNTPVFAAAPVTPPAGG